MGKKKEESSSSSDSSDSETDDDSTTTSKNTTHAEEESTTVHETTTTADASRTKDDEDEEGEEDSETSSSDASDHEKDTPSPKRSQKSNEEENVELVLDGSPPLTNHTFAPGEGTGLVAAPLPSARTHEESASDVHFSGASSQEEGEEGETTTTNTTTNKKSAAEGDDSEEESEESNSSDESESSTKTQTEMTGTTDPTSTAKKTQDTTEEVSSSSEDETETVTEMTEDYAAARRIQKAPAPPLQLARKLVIADTRKADEVPISKGEHESSRDASFSSSTSAVNEEDDTTTRLTTDTSTAKKSTAKESDTEATESAEKKPEVAQTLEKKKIPDPPLLAPPIPSPLPEKKPEVAQTLETPVQPKKKKNKKIPDPPLKGGDPTEPSPLKKSPTTVGGEHRLGHPVGGQSLEDKVIVQTPGQSMAALPNRDIHVSMNLDDEKQDADTVRLRESQDDNQPEAPRKASFVRHVTDDVRPLQNITKMQKPQQPAAAVVPPKKAPPQQPESSPASSPTVSEDETESKVSSKEQKKKKKKEPPSEASSDTVETSTMKPSTPTVQSSSLQTAHGAHIVDGVPPPTLLSTVSVTKCPVLPPSLISPQPSPLPYERSGKLYDTLQRAAQDARVDLISLCRVLYPGFQFSQPLTADAFRHEISLHGADCGRMLQNVFSTHDAHASGLLPRTTALQILSTFPIWMFTGEVNVSWDEGKTWEQSVHCKIVQNEDDLLITPLGISVRHMKLHKMSGGYIPVRWKNKSCLLQCTERATDGFFRVLECVKFVLDCIGFASREDWRAVPCVDYNTLCVALTLEQPGTTSLLRHLLYEILCEKVLTPPTKADNSQHLGSVSMSRYRHHMDLGGAGAAVLQQAAPWSVELVVTRIENMPNNVTSLSAFVITEGMRLASCIHTTPFSSDMNFSKQPVVIDTCLPGGLALVREKAAVLAMQFHAKCLGRDVQVAFCALNLTEIIVNASWTHVTLELGLFAPTAGTAGTKGGGKIYFDVKRTSLFEGLQPPPWEGPVVCSPEAMLGLSYLWNAGAHSQRPDNTQEEDMALVASCLEDIESARLLNAKFLERNPKCKAKVVNPLTMSGQIIDSIPVAALDVASSKRVGKPFRSQAHLLR